MVSALYHVLNPLHVFCRLIDKGLNLKAAMAVTRIYESTIFRTIDFTLRKINETRTNT